MDWNISASKCPSFLQTWPSMVCGLLSKMNNYIISSYSFHVLEYIYPKFGLSLQRCLASVKHLRSGRTEQCHLKRAALPKALHLLRKYLSKKIYPRRERSRESHQTGKFGKSSSTQKCQTECDMLVSRRLLFIYLLVQNFDISHRPIQILQVWLKNFSAESGCDSSRSTISSGDKSGLINNPQAKSPANFGRWNMIELSHSKKFWATGGGRV